MPEPQVTPIKSQPGIKRDGTRLEGEQYVDGQWVRFQRGLPRKIGGYRSINKYLQGIPRTIHAYTLDLLAYLHLGEVEGIERLYVDPSLSTSVISDRTPATYDSDPLNLWQFDVMTKAGEGLQLLAQVAPNLDCICNNDGGQLFTGNAFDTAPLTEVTTVPVGASLTGGVLALSPYAVAFGNDGFVMWSTPGDPTDFMGSGAGYAYVTGQKIVRGLPMRGGPGASPSGLLWSADSLIRMSFSGDSTSAFQFDTISAQSSILSSACVIEYDGVFYWVGTGRFMTFNGVVREVENNMNINFFFDNLNWNQRQKVFVNKVPRFGEIWWCFPKGDSVEPNHAVIYNVRENIWYDTALPNGGRGAGYFPSVFRRPLYSGVVDDGPGYKLWVHEYGSDEVDENRVLPIPSYFETSDISLPFTAGLNREAQVLVLEPDFVQKGPMTVQVRGRANARSGEIDGPVMTFPELPKTPEEQVVFFKEQRRQLRFRFGSNAIGGDYQMGSCFAHIQPGDGTLLGALAK